MTNKIPVLELRRERLRSREKGAGLQWHLDRTAELDGILDQAQVDHFSVDNGDRPLRDVALEVLARGLVAESLARVAM